MDRDSAESGRDPSPVSLKLAKSIVEAGQKAFDPSHASEAARDEFEKLIAR